MTRKEFYWEWFRQAWGGKLGHALAGVSIFLAFVGPFIPARDYYLGIPVKWIPALVLAGLFLITFLWGALRAPYKIFQKEHAKRLEIEDKLSERETDQAALTRLWELRADGVTHRNKQLAHDHEVKQWIEDFWRWREEVLAQAEKVSKNLAASLETLDRVRPPPVYPLSFRDPEHKRLYGIMSEILSRMYEFLQADMRRDE